MSVYFLAEKFGKFVHEVEEELTPKDLAEYLAYFNLKLAEEKKANREQEIKQRRNNRGRRR